MGGSGAGMSGQGRARVRTTGQGWVRDGEAGPEVRADGAGLEGRDAESSGTEVGDVDIDDLVAGLAVKSGWVGYCTEVSTLFAPLKSKVEKNSRTLVCHFSVQPERQLHLPILVIARLDWVWGGGGVDFRR